MWQQKLAANIGLQKSSHSSANHSTQRYSLLDWSIFALVGWLRFRFLLFATKSNRRRSKRLVRHRRESFSTKVAGFTFLHLLLSPVKFSPPHSTYLLGRNCWRTVTSAASRGRRAWIRGTAVDTFTLVVGGPHPDDIGVPLRWRRFSVGAVEGRWIRPTEDIDDPRPLGRDRRLWSHFQFVEGPIGLVQADVDDDEDYHWGYSYEAQPADHSVQQNLDSVR